jgi:CO/xanthine dehydrogenase Mo-binding subunit
MQHDVQSLPLSRRALLQAGAAMVVAFQLPAAKNAHAQFAGPSPKGNAVDSWLVIHEDNTASVYLGRAEFGNGTTTGMLQVAADELDMAFAQVKAIPLETGVTRDQGVQVSSSSIQMAAPNLRMAAAEARHALVALAAQRFGVAASELDARAGVISTREATPRRVTYGELLAGKRFDLPVSGNAVLKKPSEYRVVGQRLPRLDIPAKAAGTYEFIPYVKLPGMLHGRIVRPAGQGGVPPRVKSIDESSVAGIPGVRVLRQGDLVGVVALKEWHAIKAAAALKVDWDMPPVLSGHAGLQERMRAEKTTDTVLVETGNAGDAFAASAHKVAASFFGPYEMHAPFGPNVALADVRADSALVICSTQTLYPTRNQVAAVLGMPAEQVRVRYVEGAGTFGHSCYDDAAQAAALLSKLAAAPVRVQFSRAQEHGWDNYGPAHAADVRASCGPDGRLTSYEYHGWQHAWYPTETAAVMGTGAKVDKLRTGVSTIVNKVSAGGIYTVPNRRIVNHDIAGLHGYLKGSYLRSPLDLSICFGSEQVLDELAYRARLDPIEFRRRNIEDARWLGALEAVEKASGWKPRVATTAAGRGGKRRGRGVGLGTHFHSYGAAVAEVEVDMATGVMRVLHLYGALDAGLLVNPNVVEQQIEGMLIQAASRVMHEQVGFDKTGVTSLDWASYPILRMNETPQVTAIAISRPEHPSTGAGEEVLAAAGAAIANAFFDATGKRLYERPMTVERMRAALKA